MALSACRALPGLQTLSAIKILKSLRVIWGFFFDLFCMSPDIAIAHRDHTSLSVHLRKRKGLREMPILKSLRVIWGFFFDHM
jgi:hypothetical protein